MRGSCSATPAAVFAAGWDDEEHPADSTIIVNTEMAAATNAYRHDDRDLGVTEFIFGIDRSFIRRHVFGGEGEEPT